MLARYSWTTLDDFRFQFQEERSIKVSKIQVVKQSFRLPHTVHRTEQKIYE